MAPASAAMGPARYRAATTRIDPLTFASRAMGGRLVVHLAAAASDEPRAQEVAPAAPAQPQR